VERCCAIDDFRGLSADSVGFAESLQTFLRGAVGLNIQRILSSTCIRCITRSSQHGSNAWLGHNKVLVMVSPRVQQEDGVISTITILSGACLKKVQKFLPLPSTAWLTLLVDESCRLPSDDVTQQNFLPFIADRLEPSPRGSCHTLYSLLRRPVPRIVENNGEC
jgi:hypothetical protein